jgi:hypothetical protein
MSLTAVMKIQQTLDIGKFFKIIQFLRVRTETTQGKLQCPITPRLDPRPYSQIFA